MGIALTATHVPRRRTEAYPAAVHERTVPFYNQQILPKLKEGRNVLVVSHGNTIRSLMKYLERISDEAIADLEMPFGQILLYHVDESGLHHGKEVRQIYIVPPHA